MAAANKIELTCDLCKYPPKAFKDLEEAKSEGWLVIGQEHYYEERSFFDSHVCPSCRQKIVAAHAKR